MGKYKFKNRKFPKQFKIVADYIKSKKGVTVSLGSETKFTGHFSREIVIHHNFDLNSNGLIALLHECGHSLQPPTNIGVNSYKNLDEKQYPAEFHLGRFMNEVDAWNRGFELARLLNLQIDKKLWEKEKEKMLLTYFK